MRARIGLVALAMFATGCATAPKSQAERRSLVAESDAAVQTMTAKDSSLQDLIDRSPGYAVFPDIGEAGAVLGGAYGRGVVYQEGRPVGFVELNQGSVGATIGAQAYSEMIVFHNQAALERVKSGNFDVGAEASAVALKAGAAAATRSEGGISVFQMPRGGLMATAAVTGQKINYEPASESFDSRDSDAMTAGTHVRADVSTNSRSTNGTNGANEASAYRVDQNLKPSEQIQLDTGRDALKDVSDQPKANRQDYH